MGIKQRIADWVLENRTTDFDTMNPLLAVFLRQDTITRAQAMDIPTFAGCVRFIAETVAGLPIKLYRRTEAGVQELEHDPRVLLLNGDTGDLLSGWQLKKAIAEDLVVEGGGYAYINRWRNEAISLHYVPRHYISFLPGVDPIYKSCGIVVNGSRYSEHMFIKATRKTVDGVRGTGALQEHQLVLAVAYNILKYENNLVKTGGNRRGVLKAEKKLEQKALDELRDKWKDYNEADKASLLVLNAGISFQETSATSVEQQLNERKKTLSNEICRLFGVSENVLSGSATDEEYSAAIKIAVAPVLASIESALNRDLLLESEKGDLYFMFDNMEFLRYSIEKRFETYAAAIASNVLQIDEARKLENMPPLGLTFVKLGLQDVLYDPEAGTFFIPNMNALGDFEGTVTMPEERIVGDIDYIQDPVTGKMMGSRPRMWKPVNYSNGGGSESNDESSGTSQEEKQKKIDSISIDFESDNILPGLNKEDLNELGKEDKPVLLKKSIIERNLLRHPDVDASDYARLIGQALYNSDERFGGREHHNPDYMNFVKYGERRAALTLIELADRKEYYEIVHIFEPSNTSVGKMKP
ncbi:MAG: phage portal protein [Oscillospiraceae bacterium]|nr:phage portal protein [Oscillospiraceae bacterium]